MGRELPTWPFLALICAASALVVVLLGTRLTFFNDDWYFLLQRPGLESHAGVDVLLAPHNGNLSLLLTIAYKALVALFGLNAQLPFRLLLAAALSAVGGLVYLLVSVRVGRIGGLMAATVVALLGPAWEDLLFFAAINHVGAVAAGLAALFAMEHDSPRRNTVACVLLVAAVLLSNSGIPFVVGAVLAVALRRRPRQLWVAIVPALVFAAWWVSYGGDGPSYVSARNVAQLPHYVLESIATGLASTTGLSNGSPASYARGYVLLGLAAVGIAILWRKRGRPAPGLLVFAGTALAFWVLTGASFIPGREPLASRYQLIDVVVLILMAAEMLRGVQLGHRASAMLALVSIAVVGLNARTLVNGYRFMREHSGYVKSDLGALELTRRQARPDVWLLQPVARDPYLSGVTAGSYFAQTQKHGSPPFYSPAQIASAPSGQRRAADSVLAAAERIAPAVVARPASSFGCRRLPVLGRRARSELPVPSGAVLLTNLDTAPLVIGVRRFAPPLVADYVGFLASGASARLAIPPDRGVLPWHLVVWAPAGSAGSVTVCGA